MKFDRMFKLLILAALLLLIACDDNGYDDRQGDEPHDITISIIAPHQYESVIRIAEFQLQSEFRQRDENINFSVDLTLYYGWHIHETIQHQTRLQTMFMTGDAYNIIFWDSHPFRTYAEAGFLLDFYDLIDQHPVTMREDFYSNILEAFEHNGGLYVFPISFGFSYVGINSSLPQSIIDEFVWRDSITIIELMQIYQALRRDYGDSFEHLYISYAPYLRTQNEILLAVASQFIDFDSRTSSLNSREFVEFLELWRDLTPSIGQWNDYYFLGTPIEWAMGRLFHEIIFAGFSYGLMPINALFTPTNERFLNVIPVVDEQGRMLIMNKQPTQWWEGNIWAKLMVPAIGDGAVEWEFIQKVMGILRETYFFTLQAGGPYSLGTPITRSEFDRNFERATDMFFNEFFSARPFFDGIDNQNRGGFEQVMREARTTLSTHNEMPAAIFEFNEVNAPGLLLDQNLLMQFLLGLSTADELAMELHNRMSLWLIE